MAGLRDLSAQAAGTCPGTGLLSGAHEGGVEQGACASGVVQQGKEKQEKHRELQATVPTDLRDDAMHATGLFFFVTAPGRFARGVRFTLGAILHVLHVCVCGEQTADAPEMLSIPKVVSCNACLV